MGYKVIRIGEAEYELLKRLSEKERRPISAIASEALDFYLGCKRPEFVETVVGAKVKEILEIYKDISRLLERSKRLHKLLTAVPEG